MKLLLPIHRPLSVVITHARKRHNNTHDISLAETIIITSSNSRPPKTSRICSSMNLNSRNALWGIAARKLRHIRSHGNFIQNGVPKGGHYRKGGYSYILITYDPVPWCLFPFLCVFSKRKLSICLCNQLLYSFPCSLSWKI